MRVRLGCEIAIEIPEAMPVVSLLEASEEHCRDIEQDTGILATPNLAGQSFRDMFGNRRRRFEAPAGCLTLLYDAVVSLPDAALEPPPARRSAPREFPHSMTGFLAGSRHCEVESLRSEARKLFGAATGDAARVQAVCAHAAAQSMPGGGAEDAAHTAIALCRALGIPARYVRGFGGATNGSPPTGFSIWIEAFCEGRWQSFDLSPGGASLGRVAVARGRDAADVPLFQAPGPFRIRGLKTWLYAQDVEPQPAPGARAASAAALRLVA